MGIQSAPMGIHKQIVLGLSAFQVFAMYILLPASSAKNAGGAYDYTG